MEYFKILITLAFYIRLKNAEAGSIASFPIGGIFNRQTPANALSVFQNIMSNTEVFHERILESQVVDCYSTSLELCSFTSDNKGITALVDSRPTNGICDTVCLLCNRYNIFHLSTDWQIPESIAEDTFTFSYHPPPQLISKAIATLIKTLQWEKFSILYEDENRFAWFQEVINSWPDKYDPILFQQLDPESDNRETFKHIFKVAHVSYHVLDCKVDHIRKYLKEVIDVENSTEYQSFILTNLDAHTVKLDDIEALMANVSVFHLTVPNDVRWKDIGMDPGDESVGVETALIADALRHMGKAITAMQSDNNGPGEMKQPPALCYKNLRTEYAEEAWETGNELRTYLINTNYDGFTGNITFDNEGKRTEFILHYSKLNMYSEFIHAGFWDSKTNKITMENVIKDRSTAWKPNSKIKVVTKGGLPYYEEKKTENGTVQRGFTVDFTKTIIGHMEKVLGMELDYEIYRASGDKYGSLDRATKKWDGIIGDLIEHKADLAICDLTITSERNAVVDFSLPFMTLGISMLFREPDPEVPDKFSFMKPLSLDVWLYLATAYIIVSFILLICARMSQDDWVNPHPCNQNPENLENIWSLYNCMWLTMGSIMTQGCDILPRAVGSRWITGLWWFFALIVTASYTANMSTFLSNSRRSTEINDVKELSEQNKVSYGAVYNASTFNFFQSSNDSVYQKIWTVMESARPTVFTKSNDEGMTRVLKSKGKFAFFMESTAIEYYTQRHCTLKMVGPKLDSKEYGIAMPKNYPNKGLVDNAILQLQQSGDLEKLKNTWWVTEDNPNNCKESESEEDDSGSLQMKNTSGIFLVLGFGGVLGLFVAVVDFLLYAREICVKEGVTFKEALSSEWRASLNPRQLHRLAAPPRSAPPSTATPSPHRERSHSRAVSMIRAAQSFINFDEIY